MGKKFGKRQWTDAQRKAFFAKLDAAGGIKPVVIGKKRPHKRYQEGDPVSQIFLTIPEPLFKEMQDSTGRTYRKYGGIKTKQGARRAIAHAFIDYTPPSESNLRQPRSRTLLRIHSGVNVELRGQRLGTALYVLGLKQAKRHGFKGIYSPHSERSLDAAKVWENVKTRTYGQTDMEKYDVMDSVRPHAKRRGAKLKKKRKEYFR